MIPQLIQKLISAQRVEPAEIEDALHDVMLGNVDEAKTAGLLVALAANRVGAGTLAACARAMRAHRVAVDTQVRPLVDTCGTGGDGSGTFNISTATALVLAASGAAVAKHGNRGVSSKVGSADVLEAAGCGLEQDSESAGRLLDAVGFVFLFAPAFHPAMRHVAPVRRSLGIRTIFNLLGPLTNPALADSQLLGVYDPELTRVVARALRELGTRSALVVHCDGMDELGLHGVTRGHRLRDGEIEPFRLEPEELGLQRTDLSAIAGGDVHQNLDLLRRALAGEPGPHADVVALNVAAALDVCDKAPNMVDGLAQARELLASGKALRVLERYGESTGRRSKASA